MPAVQTQPAQVVQGMMVAGDVNCADEENGGAESIGGSCGRSTMVVELCDWPPNPPRSSTDQVTIPANTIAPRAQRAAKYRSCAHFAGMPRSSIHNSAAM